MNQFLSDPFLKEISKQYSLSSVELDAMKAALQGSSTEEIGKRFGITAIAVRKRLGSVYKKFDIPGSGHGKLSKLRSKIKTIYREYELGLARFLDIRVSPVDTENFVGRFQEIRVLEKWITDDRCRLIGLFGIAGIGKTSLASKLAHNLKQEFEYVIWQSLVNEPTFDSIVENAVYLALNTEAEYRFSSSIPGGYIEYFLRILQQHRCLVVIDNFESVLQEKNIGMYKVSHEVYGRFLSDIGTATHQSCVIVTSREKPRELAVLEGHDLPVRAFDLKGLEISASKNILKRKGVSLSASEQDISRLVEAYSGNPFALNLVATTIQSISGGNISNFLSVIDDGSVVFDDIQMLLDQQFNRLSDLEKTIMYWLSINCDYTSLDKLFDKIIPPRNKLEILENLKSLERRSLIEVSNLGLTTDFMLLPIVAEYTKKVFLDKMYQSILSKNFNFINSYSLIMASSSSVESQIRLVLKPFSNRLLEKFGTSKNLMKYLKVELLNEFKGDDSVYKSGYLAGNIINIMSMQSKSIENFDFSGLKIWQAYLKEVFLNNINFERTHWKDSVFIWDIGSVLSVSLSRSGKILGTGGIDNQVYLWKISNGELLKVLGRHDNWVRSVSFSSDETLLSSAGDDGILMIWNVQNGTPLHSIKAHTNWIWCVCFHPEKKVVASASADGTIKLWNALSGELIRNYVDHTSPSLYESKKAHNFFIRTLSFYPGNGNFLISGGVEGLIKLWDVDSGKILYVAHEHNTSVRCMAFSPSGDFLATGDDGGAIKIWKVKISESQGLELKMNLNYHFGSVRTMSFLDETILISGGDDKTLRSIDIITGEVDHLINEYEGRIWSLSTIPNSGILASGSDDKLIKIWDTKNWQCVQTLRGYSNWIYSVNFTSKSDLLISGSDDGKLRFWDSISGEILHDSLAHSGRIWTVTSSSDEQLVATAGEDGVIKLWDVRSQKCLKELYGHEGWIRTIAFSPENDVLASGSDDRAVMLWDVKSGKCIDRIGGHSNIVRSILFLPNKNILVTSGDDGTIKFWKLDAVIVEHVNLIPEQEYRVWSIACNRDGSILATTIDNPNEPSIQLWDVRNINYADSYKNRDRHLMTLKGSPMDWIRSVAFSPDSQLLASGHANGRVRLWNVHSGLCVHVFEGHTDCVRSVVFSHDGLLLASGSQDGSIRIWDMDTRQNKCIPLRISRPYEGVNILGAKGLNQSQLHNLKQLGAQS